MKSKLINVVIPAAGKTSSKLLPISSDISNSMIPINGQPIIKWIIDELLEQGLENVKIAVSNKDKQLSIYVADIYRKRANIELLQIENTTGLADTLYQVIKTIKSDNPLLIVLGDTIFKEKLKFDYDWVKYAKVDESFRWCLVELDKNNYVQKYIDKPDNYKTPAKALVGLYFLKNKKTFQNALRYVVKNKITIKQKTQISSALEIYSQKRNIKAELIKHWFDCGSIDNYYETKRKLMQARSFNKIKVDGLLGTITKTSHNKAKFIDEINWYINLPKELKILTPRIIDYSLSESEPLVTMEYYGYPTLSELWTYHHLHLDVWKSIIKKLFKIISIFKKYQSRLYKKDFSTIYWEKTVNRFSRLSHPLFKSKTLTINGEKYGGFYSIKNHIKKYTQKLADNKDVCIIHGDLCFTNILCDLNSQIIKLLDPRGSFGKKGIYGDIKYDLAKLRHSISGNYDFIVNDLFDLKHKDSIIDYKLHINEVNQKVSNFFDSLLKKKGYNLNNIKFIEGLLFVSMIPLHPEKIERQIVMYSKGIKKINEVLYENRH